MTETTPPAETALKTCTRCGDTKPETAFHRRGQQRHAMCAACRTAAARMQDAWHRQEAKKPSQDSVARFWARVTRTDHCWIWTGPIGNGDLYGRFYTEGRHWMAHRFSYFLTHGDVPAGLQIDHLCHGWDETCVPSSNGCRHRACVNPGHLEAVTLRVNALRGRGVSGLAAARTHCLKGHPYSADNTYRTPQGFRNCRACMRERRALGRARRAAQASQKGA